MSFYPVRRGKTRGRFIGNTNQGADGRTLGIKHPKELEPNTVKTVRNKAQNNYRLWIKAVRVKTQAEHPLAQLKALASVARQAVRLAERKYPDYEGMEDRYEAAYDAYQHTIQLFEGYVRTQDDISNESELLNQRNELPNELNGDRPTDSQITREGTDSGGRRNQHAPDTGTNETLLNSASSPNHSGSNRSSKTLVKQLNTKKDGLKTAIVKGAIDCFIEYVEDLADAVGVKAQALRDKAAAAVQEELRTKKATGKYPSRSKSIQLYASGQHQDRVRIGILEAAVSVRIDKQAIVEKVLREMPTHYIEGEDVTPIT